jgi:hypothetical protein
MALWRASATAPSDDQSLQIYRDERALFQAGAKCTIDGTSTQCTAAAYDDVTDLVHVGTPWGRSSFRGLQRVDSEATQVGQVNALAAIGGAVMTGGTGVRFYQPAQQLRDELKRKDEARRALGRIPVPIWYTCDGVVTTFIAPLGFDVLAVYRQGMLMRDGATNDYTASFDGYRWTVTLASAPGVNHNVCIMGVRNGAN